MDSHDHDHFEGATSGASQTIPAQCSTLRKGGHVMIKGQPCKIVEMSTSKTGKHGHAKVHIVGLNIFDGKKLEENCPSTHNIDTPNVTTKNYEVLGIEDGFFELMDDEGGVREDIKFDPTCCKGVDLDSVTAQIEKNNDGDTKDDDKMDITAKITSAIGLEKITEITMKKAK